MTKGLLNIFLNKTRILITNYPSILIPGSDSGFHIKRRTFFAYADTCSNSNFVFWYIIDNRLRCFRRFFITDFKSFSKIIRSWIITRFFRCITDGSADRCLPLWGKWHGSAVTEGVTLYRLLHPTPSGKCPLSDYIYFLLGVDGYIFFTFLSDSETLHKLLILSTKKICSSSTI